MKARTVSSDAGDVAVDAGGGTLGTFRIGRSPLGRIEANPLRFTRTTGRDVDPRVLRTSARGLVLGWITTRRPPLEA